jgi:hypothetical protein
VGWSYEASEARTPCPFAQSGMMHKNLHRTQPATDDDLIIELLDFLAHSTTDPIL